MGNALKKRTVARVGVGALVRQSGKVKDIERERREREKTVE